MQSMFKLRSATLDDAAEAARMFTEIHPDEPQGEVDVRHRWKQRRDSRVINRYVVLDGEAPAGIALAVWPARWPEGEKRYGDVIVFLMPSAHRPDDFDRLLAELGEHVEAAGAEALVSRVREDDDFLIAGLERNGFRRDRLSKAWELDLSANHERLLALRSETRAGMRQIGVELRPLAAISDPERYRWMFDLDIATSEDVPHTVPFVRPTFDEYLAQLNGPSVHEDRFWTAWRGGELVALSFLEYPSVGPVWTGYTCCRRDQRGQGIARAVKMETLGQAIELGVDRVRTDNDEQNAPMLHINEGLGYYRIPGFLSYLRP